MVDTRIDGHLRPAWRRCQAGQGQRTTRLICPTGLVRCPGVARLGGAACRTCGCGRRRPQRCVGISDLPFGVLDEPLAVVDPNVDVALVVEVAVAAARLARDLDSQA